MAKESTQYKSVYIKKYPLNIFMNSKRYTMKYDVENETATIRKSNITITQRGTTLLNSKYFFI
ncbi:hypothetical protein MuYL_3240 [Mucilaginibacter xinganensis]|uniref:Uncharacterized protein n=1 Tax=Mucilaginibacter xinganensis TaxID=1234841 RepID=A0A223NZ37_9SPHI|nr:hypothetical protein MuYL_3240 [Mucilaginibacter xinganensis]